MGNCKGKPARLVMVSEGGEGTVNVTRITKDDCDICGICQREIVTGLGDDAGNTSICTDCVRQLAAFLKKK